MHNILDNPTIAVVGLGYVGLPLAVAFGKHYRVVGFDIDTNRIAELQAGKDRTLETSTEELNAATHLTVTAAQEDLAQANVYIITVPTPIDSSKKPDLGPLRSASTLVGRHLQKGNVVIYESTVYPGCTEDLCVPLLEQNSGLTFNQDFSCGYSPERINPGDKKHRLETIVKVTSGSNEVAAKQIDALYQTIIEAGTHLAPSIKVAEAAKVIENTQRDINIAFVNELALIFERMGIDTAEVLNAAGTKWNFLKFTPGLVGGHCIGVDPYYLTYKAEALEYHPEVILSGRRINDNMGQHVAVKLTKLMARKSTLQEGSKVLVLGITFKENCPDIRNSKVVDIYAELLGYGLSVDVYDPWADPEEVKQEYGISLMPNAPTGPYEGIILAVSHDAFLQLNYPNLKGKHGVLFDVKAFLPKENADARL